MVFQCINICQVPWEVLKTTVFGLGFQHLPQDLVNVNAWKTMFDPNIVVPLDEIKHYDTGSCFFQACLILFVLHFADGW